METKITTTYNFAFNVDGLTFNFSITAESQEQAKVKLAEYLVKISQELMPKQ